MLTALALPISAASTATAAATAAGLFGRTVLLSAKITPEWFRPSAAQWRSNPKLLVAGCRAATTAPASNGRIGPLRSSRRARTARGRRGAASATFSNNFGICGPPTGVQPGRDHREDTGKVQGIRCSQGPERSIRTRTYRCRSGTSLITRNSTTS